MPSDQSSAATVAALVVVLILVILVIRDGARRRRAAVAERDRLMLEILGLLAEGEVDQARLLVLQEDISPFAVAGLLEAARRQGLATLRRQARTERLSSGVRTLWSLTPAGRDLVAKTQDAAPAVQGGQHAR